MGGSASTAIGPESWTGTVLPFLIDAARQGAKKVVLDGKTFAPFGMVPHAVEPEKVAAYRPKASAGRPPAKVDLQQYMTHVEDQSQTNSCCANAVAGAYEYINKRYAMAKGDRTEDISRLFIYYVGRKRDQQLFREDTSVAPKDEGMSLGGAISALELKGACMEKNWPFNIDRVNHKPNDPCFTEAVRYKIAESKKVPVDLSSMRRCLAEGNPIVFGLKLTAQFFKPAPGGGISTPDPDDPQSSEHGLHAMLIVGYNDRQEVFIVRNSWGTSWGDGGYGYVPYSYICNDDFNFLGQYAIMGLTEMDFTPGVQDDGRDYNFQDTGDDEIDLETYEDDPEEDEDDDFDVEDEFDPKSEAERTFNQLFTQSDKNQDGKIDAQELMSCFLMNGIRMNPLVLAQICATADLDHNGSYDFDEFWHLMQIVKGGQAGAGCF
ncbi:unnamed protein product [Durusdinium trenchii]|uniref:Uncharacterized protein n=2 Tax=Durusdinium trenchii TaxID=1381693 RepID=A0ABP0KFX0_9DINO